MAIVSTELTILNELAKVTATRCEWLALAEIVTQHVRNPEFLEPYRRMVDELECCYQFTIDILSPFSEIATQQQFEEKFEVLYTDYQQNYLLEASKPRHVADRTYDIFLGVMQRREFGTTYPLLKRTFDRLDYFIDKYVTNDAWLVMSIDAILKRLSRFLHDVAEMKGRDLEESFMVYRALMRDVATYINLIDSHTAVSALESQ